MQQNRMFENRVILAYLIDPPEEFAGGVAISDPHVEEMMGRTFITGTVPQEYDWSSGAKVSVAFDQIAHFLEFESEEDFLSRSGPPIPGMNENPIQ